MQLQHLLPVQTDKFCDTITAYANLKRQPLSLGQFIPCTSEGEVLEEPVKMNFTKEEIEDGMYQREVEQYNEAMSRVLFNGFKAIQTDVETIYGNETLQIYLNYEKKMFFMHSKPYSKYIGALKTIEDLVPYQLTLTENAIKLLS